MNKTLRAAALCWVISAMFLIVACGGGSSSGPGGTIIPVNHYFKCDTDWNNDLMGASTYRICERGELLSSIAMIMSATDPSVDPGNLNIWMTNNSGYFQSETTMFLSKLSDHPTAPVNYSDLGAYALTTFKAKLDAGTPLMVWVNSNNNFIVVFGYGNDGTTASDFLYYSGMDMTGTAFSFDTALTPGTMFQFEYGGGG